MEGAIVIVPEGVAPACLCGANWMRSDEFEWGVKVRCEVGHVLDYKWGQRPRVPALERMLVGGLPSVMIKVGSQASNIRSEPVMPRWLRFRLWWWRTTKRWVESVAVAGSTMRGRGE